MKVFLAALLLIGIAVFGMCFNIIFLKKDFPNSDVGTNENMRNKGIRCYREEDEELHAGSKRRKFNESCSNCGETECWQVNSVQQTCRDEAGDSR